METLKTELSKWYTRNRRDLPWRKTKDPYRIWISEVMLQQTSVSVVIGYYEKFLKAFPTVIDLARAKENRVLSLWSGLGYYSRARNIHKAAKAVAKRGAFPSTSKELLELPGIGSYTASAVASIAFGEEVAAIDGNVIRVITRLYDISGDCSKKETQKIISTKAAGLISGQDPSAHNQAMMELGATVCVPQNPICFVCPAMKVCQSLKAATISERPVKPKKRKQEPWVWEMYLFNRNGKIALTKKNNGTPWLKNTWVLPGRAVPWKAKKRPSFDFKHSITHHKIFVQIKKPSVKLADNKDYKWVMPNKIEKHGVSSIVQKALRHL